MAADLVTIIETVAVTQFLTPAAKNLGETVLERSKQLVGKATAMLSAVGRQPQAVEEKLLVPLVQGAGLESDPTLAELWAALLANSADPAQRVAVQPGFAEVLRQLTPTDALVLIHIYRHVPAEFGVTTRSIVQIQTANFAAVLALSEKFFAISIENLIRLRLCDTSLSSKIRPADTELPPPVAASVYPTFFGYEFLQAVTPPTT